VSKEYRIKEQKYKYPHCHGSLFVPQYKVFSISKRLWHPWMSIGIILSSMEEAIKVIENDIEKDREVGEVETIIHNYPLKPKEDEKDV